MRLFAAIALPESARAALGEVIAPWRADDWPVRWVAAEGYHTTLQFFGEVSEGAVGALAEALSAAAGGTPPLDLCLTGFGAFPAARRARVLWAGLSAPPALELMQHRLVSATQRLGFIDDRPRFQPHITVGRVAPDRQLGAAAARRIMARALDHAFVVDEVVLFQSVASSGGVRYHPIHREVLAG